MPQVGQRVRECRLVVRSAESLGRKNRPERLRLRRRGELLERGDGAVIDKRVARWRTRSTGSRTARPCWSAASATPASRSSCARAARPGAARSDRGHQQRRQRGDRRRRADPGAAGCGRSSAPPAVGGSIWFEERWRAGEIELELVPQGTLSERMRAAGAGPRRLLHPHRRRLAARRGQGGAGHRRPPARASRSRCRRRRADQGRPRPIAGATSSTAPRRGTSARRWLPRPR